MYDETKTSFVVHNGETFSFSHKINICVSTIGVWLEED